MKKIQHNLLCVLLVCVALLPAGCTPDAETDSAISNAYTDGVLIKPSFLLMTRGVTPAPKVTSMRVIVFDANGNCAANSLFASTALTVNNVTGGWQYVAPDVRCTPPVKSGTYDVYAILNEEGMLSEIEGTTTTLMSLLSAISVGSSSLNKFLSYYSARLNYKASMATATDPAFIVSAKASFTATAGASLTAQEVVFEASATSERTMATVTVDAITSEPESGSYSSTDVPRIFILDLELTNVPTAATWTTAENDEALVDDNFTYVKFGGKNASGYYDRTWTDGTISGEFKLEKWETADSDARIWAKFKTGHTDQIDGLTTDEDLRWGKNKNDKALLESFGMTLKTSNTALFSLLDGFFTAPAFWSSSIVSIPTGTLTVNDKYWTVPVGKTLYVPENVTTDKSSATMIHVKAALGSPKIDVAGVDWSTAYTGSWGTPLYLAGMDERELYSISDLAVSLGITQNNKQEEWYKNYASQNASTDVVVTEYNPDGTVKKAMYYPYLDAFKRLSKSAANASVSSSTAGAVGGWDAITTSEYIHDFYIPVNNQDFDSDYSVRRNTKYTVTLHLGQAAYNHMTTPSSSAPMGTRTVVVSDDCGLTATVTAESIDD